MKVLVLLLTTTLGLMAASADQELHNEKDTVHPMMTKPVMNMQTMKVSSIPIEDKGSIKCGAEYKKEKKEKCGSTN